MYPPHKEIHRRKTAMSSSGKDKDAVDQEAPSSAAGAAAKAQTALALAARERGQTSRGGRDAGGDVESSRRHLALGFATLCTPATFSVPDNEDLDGRRLRPDSQGRPPLSHRF
ncbi:hypothetical protein JTB14_033529 [Gonioctena quinquepunctata]|nr:hypothetical protein JTB14_033529 [Gonioctena quinquepunctata]